eukprot:303439-Pleurochrysis_carterae.AAC.1
MFLVKQEAVTKQLRVTEEKRQTNVSWQLMNEQIAEKHSQKQIGRHSHGAQHGVTLDMQKTAPCLQHSFTTRRSKQRTTYSISFQYMKEAHYRKYTADGDSRNQEHVYTSAGAEQQSDASEFKHIAVNKHLGWKHANTIGNSTPRTESNDRSNRSAARATLKRATFERYVEVSIVCQYHASHNSSALLQTVPSGREKRRVTREGLTRIALMRRMEDGGVSRRHASYDSTLSSHARPSSMTHSRMYIADDGNVSQYRARIN